MATLTIKNLPDDLYARLKAQAKQRHRSLNGEAIVCLEEALGSPPLDAEGLIAEAEAHNREILGDRVLPDLEEVLASARRERNARPFR